jgi:hypothetical protein
MRRIMTRANKLVLRVQVMGGDVHLLQCHLDRNGIVPVVSQPISPVSRVLVEDGSNLGCHAPHCHQRIQIDGLAPGKGSGMAVIFCQIENRYFPES